LHGRLGLRLLKAASARGWNEDGFVSRELRIGAQELGAGDGVPGVCRRGIQSTSQFLPNCFWTSREPYSV
jgi:hypothetical protein